MKKAVLYVRVSSKEQEQEGFSIPAQQKALREYARRNGFTIGREFVEVETAKQAGRPEFTGMLRYLGNHPEIQDVLVEKTDRLYRNFRDLVAMNDLARNVHLVKEGQVLGPKSRSHEKFVHDIKVVLAKNYIDNLSEETRKGMVEKAEQGFYPSYAPLGYVNSQETGRMEVDFTRANLIRELFQVYSEGRTSLSELTRLAGDKGLRTRSGNRIQKSSIATMLQSPVYVGDFLWNGVYYKGKHHAILPRDLFERVQVVAQAKHQARSKRWDFAFRGLLTCGRCGCSVTAEEKKGRYVYYHCTGARGKCGEKPIREEALARELGEPLKRFRLTAERVAWILEALRESYEDEQNYHRRETRKLEAEYEALEAKIGQLYEDKLSGTVTEAFWKGKYKEYVSRQARIQELVREHREANRDYLANGARILELAQKAYSLYVSQNPVEQRKLLDLVLSNSVLRDGRVVSELRKPFDTLADGAIAEEELRAQDLPFEAANPIWLPGLDSNSPALTSADRAPG